jgi:hypothetical protein
VRAHREDLVLAAPQFFNSNFEANFPLYHKVLKLYKRLHVLAEDCNAARWLQRLINLLKDVARGKIVNNDQARVELCVVAFCNLLGQRVFRPHV